MISLKIDNLAVFKNQPETVKHSYPLLLIHGWGGTSRYLKNYLYFFARDGWTTYAINLRGHYPSDHDMNLAQATIEDYTDDVTKVILDLGIENCALIGHSMGGLIAQKTAMQFESLKALVVISSAPPLGVMLEKLRQDLFSPESFMKPFWEMMKFEPVPQEAFLIELTLLNNIPAKERENIYRMFVAESLVVGCQMLQGVVVEPEKIKCPKLVIGCKHDAMIPEEMEQKLALFLQADYIAYEQFGHLPMLEKGWEQSAADISQWLQHNIHEGSFQPERTDHEIDR